MIKFPPTHLRLQLVCLLHGALRLLLLLVLHVEEAIGEPQLDQLLLSPQQARAQLREKTWCGGDEIEKRFIDERNRFALITNTIYFKLDIRTSGILFSHLHQHPWWPAGGCRAAGSHSKKEKYFILFNIVLKSIFINNFPLCY